MGLPMGSQETSAICSAINKLAEEFRRAGRPVYYIYLNPQEYRHNDLHDLHWAYGGPHKIEIAPSDRIIRKIKESALSQETRARVLACFAEDSVDKPYIAGFHIPMCVRANVFDFVDLGFDTGVLEGHIGSGWPINPRKNEAALAEMKAKGAKFIAPYV